MSDHVLKTIEDFESKITEHEREIKKIRAAINIMCSVAGMEPKYHDADDMSGVSGSISTATVKPDQFYGKPLSTAVREALNTLRSVNKAPATIDAIYDMMVRGGYPFESKARDSNIQSLSVSVGKNSALFVKLNNGLIGVTDWYESNPRAKRNGKKPAGTSDSDDPVVSNDDVSASPSNNATSGEDLV